jgi:hypothetical protein
VSIDDAKQKIESSGDHIWLRYATQFTVAGRTRTVEMSIPVPLGASEDQREQLLHEADAGMLQLSNHVEKIATQLMQRGQVSTVASTSGQNGRAPASVPPFPRPAAAPALQTTDHPAPPRTRENSQDPASQRNDTLVRQPVGASMPVSTNDVPNNLTIPQFVKIISETLGLDSKQAMSKLGVRSLSGINLRKELERLRQIIQLENGNETVMPSVREVRESLSPASRPASSSGPAAGQTQSYTATNEARAGARNDVGIKPIGFDEEERESDIIGLNNGLDDDLDNDDDLDELDFSQELTERQRARAQEIIKSLRESGGMTIVSANRMNVLNTIVSSQVSEQQLLTLIQKVWRVNALKKLKVDQAERLISWAKEDDFVNEVIDILKVFEEEG